MDKQEKFHQDKPMQDAQAQVISDDELDTVSGGIECPAKNLGKYCPYCGRWLYNANYDNHVATCPKMPG